MAFSDESPRSRERVFAKTDFDEFESYVSSLGASYSVRGDLGQFDAVIREQSYSFINVRAVSQTPYGLQWLGGSSSREPESLTLCVAKSGDRSLSQQGNVNLLRAGEMAILDSRMNGEIITNQDTNWTMLSIPRDVWISIAPLPILNDRFIMRADTDIGKITKFSAELLSISTDSQWQVGELTLARQLVELISLATTQNSENLPSTLHRHIRLHRVKEYINNNLGNAEMSPSDIANHFGVSSRYLGGLFAEYDTTIMKTVLHTRLRRAKELIERKNLNKMSIKEISYLVGFTNPAYFNKVFHEYFGQTPNSMARK